MSPIKNPTVFNVYETLGESVIAHHGEGLIQVYRPLDKEDFASRWHFVDFATIPPGCSIGLHQHGHNEELYFIVEGEGQMIINNQTIDIKAGDVILNQAGWSHSLKNTSQGNIKLFVVEVEI